MSQSKELFESLYTNMSNKIHDSSDTIFSGVHLDDVETDYNTFMESIYANQFFLENSIYEKNLTIQAFIENEVLSNIYTNTRDSLTLGGEELSFSQQYLCENTETEFNVKYKNYEQVETLEEGLAIGSAVLSVVSLFSAALPTTWIVAFSSVTVLGLQLLLPARYARNIDNALGVMLGVLGPLLIGTTSIFATTGALKHSNNNILNFDNIDTNPEVAKLFKNLTNVPQQGTFKKFFTKIGFMKKPSIEGINSIVASCLEQNDVTESSDEINSGNAGFLSGMYRPGNSNVISMFVNSIFKSSSDKKTEEFDKLIRYRKCLSEKLIDLYKLLLIANVAQSRDYKKLTRVMTNGFQGNPEQILGFMHVEDEKDEILRENIVSLIQFRMFLDKMAIDLGKGVFEADKESSIFLKQKLKLVDGEVEQELKKRGREIETAFESEDEFKNKDFKNKEIDEKKLKRKIWDT